MVVTIRLSKRYDLDLIALKNQLDVSLAVLMKKMILAIVNEEEFSVPLPKPSPFSKEYKTTQFCFYLSPKKDKRAIEYMNNLRTGYKCSAIKNLFRHYMNEPYISPYFVHGKNISLIKPKENVQNIVEKANEKEVEIVKEVKKEVTTLPPEPISSTNPNIPNENNVNTTDIEDSSGGFDLFSSVGKMF